MSTGLLLLLLSAGIAIAQIPGKLAYEKNCVVCHGPKGKGDGEAVRVLVGLQPTDLTQLSKKNGGKYPADAVYRSIDGRDEVAAHHLGTRRMPLWGLDFQLGTECTPQTEADACSRIKELVRYIETLQEH
ncbi:MAG: c-type cytochrome [Candidatus Binataceae bacterium]